MRRWTWNSIHSGDIELQGPETAAPGKAVVKTKIMGEKKSEIELTAEEFGLQGISVHTSIHTESMPVAMLSRAEQPKQTGRDGKIST